MTLFTLENFEIIISINQNTQRTWYSYCLKILSILLVENLFQNAVMTDYTSLLISSSSATLSKSPKQFPVPRMAAFPPLQFATGPSLPLQGSPVSLLRRAQPSERLWSATPSLHLKHQAFYFTSEVINSKVCQAGKVRSSVNYYACTRMIIIRLKGLT